MKKIVTLSILVCALIGLNAQTFTEFSAGFDPQKGDIAVADIDNDGDFDVVINGRAGNDFRGKYLRNNGDSTFTEITNNIIKPGFLADVKFDDLDGDDDLDVIFNGHSGAGSAAVSKAIAFNDGTGEYTLSSLEVPGIAPSCGFADFNNDGLTDYYVFGNGLGVCALFFQNANGTFTKDLTSFSTLDFTDPDVTVLDFNNDGTLDMFINGHDNVTSSRISAIFLNDGDGNFIKDNSQVNIIQKGYGSATWADVNGDGWLDLLLNGDGGFNSGEAASNIFRLYKNNSGLLEVATTFELFRQAAVGDGSRFADLDNDGDFDVIVAGWNPTKGRQATVVYKCTDATNFTFVEDTTWGTDKLPGVSENNFEVADLNRDGKIDIMLMGFSNFNNGANPFSFNRNIAGYTLNNTAIANTAPSAPSNLTAVTTGGATVFSWDASTDTETASASLSYQFCLKNKTTGKWMLAPNAFTEGINNGLRKITGMGNISLNTSWTLNDLPDGEYEWSVQAIDAAYEGSQFAALQSLTVGIPTEIIDAKMTTNDVNVMVRDKELHIRINSTVENASVQVFDLLGRNTYTSKISNNSTIIPLHNTTNVLVVKVMNNREVTLQKIIVN